MRLGCRPCRSAKGFRGQSCRVKYLEALKYVQRSKEGRCRRAKDSVGPGSLRVGAGSGQKRLRKGHRRGYSETQQKANVPVERCSLERRRGRKLQITPSQCDHTGGAPARPIPFPVPKLVGQLPLSGHVLCAARCG